MKGLVVQYYNYIRIDLKNAKYNPTFYVRIAGRLHRVSYVPTSNSFEIRGQEYDRTANGVPQEQMLKSKTSQYDKVNDSVRCFINEEGPFA
jgi:hypothetical protein